MILLSDASWSSPDQNARKWYSARQGPGTGEGDAQGLSAQGGRRLAGSANGTQQCEAGSRSCKRAAVYCTVYSGPGCRVGGKHFDALRKNLCGRERASGSGEGGIGTSQTSFRLAVPQKRRRWGLADGGFGVWNSTEARIALCRCGGRDQECRERRQL